MRVFWSFFFSGLEKLVNSTSLSIFYKMTGLIGATFFTVLQVLLILAISGWWAEEP